MTVAPSSLLTALTVQDTGAHTRDRLFLGPGMPATSSSDRSFGGQVMAQALIAASHTIDDDRLVHSMHGYFLRPGRASDPITLEVAELYTGRSFATRRTQAFQDGVPIMSLIASFQTEDEGIEHQAPFDMSSVPDPESLRNLRQKYAHLENERRASKVLQRPIEFRYVNDEDILLEPAPKRAEYYVWMRTYDKLPDDPAVHRAALCFGSDYLLLEPVLREHGIAWVEPGLKAASLDHSMWFHRDFRCDEWLLYVLSSDTSQGGRGLSHGRFYRQDGTHVATVAQETMVRAPGRTPVAHDTDSAEA